MKVIVVFDFDGIKDVNSPEADEVMEHMLAKTKEWSQDGTCTRCWVDEAFSTINRGEQA